MYTSHAATIGIPTVLSMFLGACVSHSTAGDYSSVRELTQARANFRLPEHEPPADRDDPSSDVRALVKQPLTEETAIRIALLNNHNLRAELRGLGIARGQLVQVNLLPNPDFDVAMRIPEKAGNPTDWDLRAGIDLTALILRGQRTAVGEAEVEAARYRAAAAVLDLGFRVRTAYYSALASRQRLELMETALAAFAAGYETARTLRAAGNTTDLDVATEHAAYEAARVAVSEAEADQLDDRERLNVLLGFHGRETTWQVAQHLPEVPRGLPEQARLESRAIEASLELAETRATLIALGRRVGLAQNTGWLPDLNVGVAAERDSGEWSVGPALRGTLPLFNHQQGAVIVNQARFDQLRDRYVATAIEVRAAVRAARNRAVSAQERARHYREVLLPARQEVLEQTVLQYNAMQVGVFQLLQARRDQLDAARMYIETLREYWRTCAELEQILAGRSTGAIGPMSSEQPRAGAMPTMSAVAH
jgi:outer membrane protein TolC